MDLEHLTKHQILLLTLLVSFVTSIATGIVTVSLMDQAPPGVTRVINQIVEHTVEQVVAAPNQAAAGTNTVKTVVIKNDDLAAQSIAAVQKSIIRIVEKGKDQLIARGVIIDSHGTALTDRAALMGAAGSEFEAILASGDRFPLTLRAQTGSTTPVAVISIAVGTSTGFAPAVLADSAKVQLGQSVIRIGGVGVDTVGAGVIAALPHKEDGSPVVEASVTSVTPGAALITLFGEVLGLATTGSLDIGSDVYSIPVMPTSVSAATSTPGKMPAS